MPLEFVYLTGTEEPASSPPPSSSSPEQQQETNTAGVDAPTVVTTTAKQEPQPPPPATSAAAATAAAAVVPSTSPNTAASLSPSTPSSQSIGLKWILLLSLMAAAISLALLYVLDSPLLAGFDAEGTRYLAKSPARAAQLFALLTVAFLALTLLAYLSE